MQMIGTGWLIQPPRDPDSDRFDRLISQMSLTEVRPYMCPKSHGNPKKCEDCDGFRTCQAGQRALRLMKEAEVKRAEAPVIKQVPVDTGKDRELFRQACESGNAWNYLMTNYGMSEAAAQEKLNFWCSHYMGIVQEFGGRKRIMDKPKAVKVTRIGDVSEKPQDAQEQASPHEDEEIQAEAQEEPERAVNRPEAAIAASVQSRMDHSRRLCEEAVESGDVREFLLAHGKTMHSVNNTVSRWRRLFPDLMADVPRLRSGRHRVEEKPEEPEEDEISLADFLAKYEKPEEPKKADDLLAEICEGLKEEKNRLMAEIRNAEERIGCIDRQLDALAAVLSAPWE